MEHDKIEYPERRYVVGGRNGYNAIDEYCNGQCVRMVDSFRSKKEASAVAINLGCAYQEGRRDALVGLVVRLREDVTRWVVSRQESETIIRKGKMVRVTGRNLNGFTVQHGKGEKAVIGVCGYDALRKD